jgi:alpha-tubulin suppressor-like RCC1 family protein
MFVLNDLGEVYVAKIEELVLNDDQIRLIKTAPQKIQAQVQFDSLVHVKDLKNVKQMACGNDHFLALDKQG